MYTKNANQTNMYSNKRKSQWEVEQEEREAKVKLQEEEKRKQQEFNEENFPRIGNAPSKLNFWGGPKSFVEIAVECAKVSETEKIFKPMKKQEEPKKQNLVTNHSNVQLPRFDNIHRYIEPEDEQSTEQLKNKEDEEGWVEVNHSKRRRQKSFEEIVNRPTTPEEGDTVWDSNAPEEHETCWDERP